MKETYTIENLAEMSGLSSRTIRNYLAGGQLEGEKIDGVWRFTEEQFSRFLSQDMVRQSVRAKANGKVYDFLLDSRREDAAACVVWDWPAADAAPESCQRERLMERVNALGLSCAYRWENGMARAILTGPPAALGALLAQGLA